MGSEGSIMHMIVSYRNNTALIRKKRLIKGGSNYFRAKQTYRKAAGGEIAFRTATSEERAIIKAKIRKESHRDSFGLILILFLGLSLTIVLTIKLWPDPTPEPKIEMANFYFFINESSHSLAIEKYYNAVFYYEQAIILEKKEYKRHTQIGLKKIYLEELETTKSDEILSKVNGLISRFPKRIELYKLRAEIFAQRDMLLQAEEDCETIEVLLNKYK